MYGYQGYPGKVLHGVPRGTGGRIRKETGAAGEWLGENGRRGRMGNDLISRGVLMQSLRNNVLVDVTPNLEQAVAEQPTAYDVDKVMERLEELASCEESRAAEYDEAGKLDMMNIYDEKAGAYRNSMRIVKSGGIE